MTSIPVVHRSKQHIIRDIEALTREPGFLHALVFLCYRDVVVDLRDAANRNWRESLSYQELGLLGGLLVKRTFQTAPASANVMARQVSNVQALFDELHDAYMAPMINSLKPPTTTVPPPPGQPPRTSSPYGVGDFFAEAIFYAGAGAYDFQYLDFSIDAACTIASQLKSRIEAKLQD